MNLPVPDPAALVVRDTQSAGDLAGLNDVLTRARVAGAPVTVVYAPTSVTHHHAAPVPAALPVPVPRPFRGAVGHPGIDVDLTGYGGGFELPADPRPMPVVAERREVAPLVLLASTWSGLGALAVSVLTGYPFAVAYTVLAAIVAGLAYVANHRNMWGR